jgi:DNA primase large subunit
MDTEALRQNRMMSHLLDSLDQGKDIGHYGRLVFAMVARHFMTDDELVEYLQKDRDFSEEQARVLVKQVQGRDYNPPRPQKIHEWQAEQDFPICPEPDDPDACNVYKDLKFPDEIYDNISEYYEQKTSK